MDNTRRSGHKTNFIVTLILFFLLLVWWLSVQYAKSVGDPGFDFKGQLFAAVYGLMALWGAFVALSVSRKWGFYNSLFGRILLSFSIGLFLQEFGQLAYSYYIYFLKVEIPYPSIGDIGYFGSVFFYIYGALLLYKLLSMDRKPGPLRNKLLMVLMPFILLSVSYFLFLRGYEFGEGVLVKNLLDIGYPLFQCIYVSLAFASLVSLTSKFSGATRKGVLLILIALISQYVSDFSFLYKAGNGTYYPGGLVDFSYLISYFLMSLAILEIGSVFERVDHLGAESNGESPVSVSADTSTLQEEA